MEVRIGGGAFVCGEETALIASIEGRRGAPRPRPPYPAQAGLWDMPTLINNVETFANIPSIVRRGGDWYASIGTKKSKGTKVFALTGKVRNVGLIEVPMGQPSARSFMRSAAAAPKATNSKRCRPAGLPAAASRNSSSISPWTMNRSGSSARSWAPAA